MQRAVRETLVATIYVLDDKQIESVMRYVDLLLVAQAEAAGSGYPPPPQSELAQSS